MQCFLADWPKYIKYEVLLYLGQTWISCAFILLSPAAISD